MDGDVEEEDYCDQDYDYNCDDDNSGQMANSSVKSCSER